MKTFIKNYSGEIIMGAIIVCAIAFTIFSVNYAHIHLAHYSF